MIIVIFILIWLLSLVATMILFGANGFNFNLGNVLLALTPILNTLIAIKLSIKEFKGINIFKDMKDTINIVFRKNKKQMKDTINIVFRNKRTNERI